MTKQKMIFFLKRGQLQSVKELIPPSLGSRIWLITGVRMNLQCVNKTEALWRRPLWTHTAPLLVINEQLSPSPLKTVNDAVGGLSIHCTI